MSIAKRFIQDIIKRDNKLERNIVTHPPGLTTDLDGSNIPNLEQAQQRLEKEGIKGHSQPFSETRGKKFQ